MAKADLTEAYENMSFIPGGADYPDRWEEDAADWRSIEHAIGRARLNIAYGAHERQMLDLFLPAGQPKGMILFIHGGYWHRFDRKFWSHFSRGGTQAGWAVVMPSYRLAPEVRISQITQDIAAAFVRASELVKGPIRLTGHSAGGHLACRMVAEDGLPDALVSRIERLVPISPLSDLRPLMQTDMNRILALDSAEAAAESPVLNPGKLAIPTEIWVGAEERPAFLDQASWLHRAWPGSTLRIAPGRHHFDVIEDLSEPSSPLMQSLLA